MTKSVEFSTGFDSYVCDGDSIETEFNGITFTATVHNDSDTGAPWEEHDGHGPVSGWTSRDKRPGELVLNEDRGSKRFYDFAQACQIARRDGWGVKGGKLDGETPRQYAARAARHDFEILQAWCADEWWWCGIEVTAEFDGQELASESLWGIEANYPGGDNSYLSETANDLAGQCLAAAIARAAELAAALSGLTATGAAVSAESTYG